MGGALFSARDGKNGKQGTDDKEREGTTVTGATRVTGVAESGPGKGKLLSRFEYFRRGNIHRTFNKAKGVPA